MGEGGGRTGAFEDRRGVAQSPELKGVSSRRFFAFSRFSSPSTDRMIHIEGSIQTADGKGSSEVDAGD